MKSNEWEKKIKFKQLHWAVRVGVVGGWFSLSLYTIGVIIGLAGV